MQLDSDGYKLQKVIDSGYVDILQFRAKNSTDNEYEDWVLSKLALVDRSKAIFLANDFVESVTKLTLDGVHVGQNDMPVTLAKKMLGNEHIVGVTVRSMEQTKDAEVHGADYVGAGTVFNTATKRGLVAKGPEYITDLINNTSMTVFPIGGITLENIPALVSGGAKRVAVASCLLESDEPDELASKIRKLL